MTPTRFRRLAIASAATTIVLFAVGGLVRGSGSGLGCSTWPGCEPGRLFPAGTIHSLIEFSHRTLAMIVGILTFACAVGAWRAFRNERGIFLPAVLAFPIWVVQAALGGLVVLTNLEPKWSVSAHFVAAIALIAAVTVLAANAWAQAGGPGLQGRVDAAFARLAVITTAVVGILLFVGTYVRASDSQLVFTDWPLMDGRLVPALGGAATVMFAHRLLAAASLLLVMWVAIRIWAMPQRPKAVVTLSSVALVLFAGQILSGAANVWTRLKPWAVVAHVGLSVLIWATLVALATVSRRLAAEGGTPENVHTFSRDGHKRSLRETTSAYFWLTKPRIIVLLLITTVPAMFLACRCTPSITLILATLLGGTIAAGSANAINCYLDRDIDEVMRRTRKRPLPAHRVTPEGALRFGFVLGAVSFFFLSITVNALAASLALSAIAFYVFVYTLWLKRTSAQNIVIGGAAGAVPALVGWAAVTGTVGLPALLLFAIVFVWTPPHFWALAMRYRGDYAAAGIPMLPVVRGEEETRRRILLYSLALFAVTLLLVPVAHMGLVYLTTAVVLGGAFIWRALKLWRHATPALAVELFRFSIVYLAVLFASVGADSLIAGRP